MANIQIELKPDSKRLIEKLSRAGLLDLRPIFKAVGISYRREVKAIFERKQPRDPKYKWAPLSERYKKWKEAHYPGRPILVLTGKLKKSMTELGSDGNFQEIGKESAVFGSTVTYGYFHDEGTDVLPQRNFSIPNDRRKKILEDQIERDIVKQVENKGGVKIKKDLF